jgi:biopolymer transport protein ExbD/biopolymer transport protein TolR
MQAAINITPLVDVVLVLLIIFMVMAPQMRTGPEVDLPDTAKPRDQGDERDQILVTLDHGGQLWIDDRAIAPEQFGERLKAAAGATSDPKVVLRSDARLRFGEVRRAMVAIEEAGFSGVGLIADSDGAKTGGE